MNGMPMDKSIISDVLQNVNLLEVSIKETANWFLQFEFDYEDIIKIYLNEFVDTCDNQKITLLYLLNELIVLSFGQFPNIFSQIAKNLSNFCTCIT